MMFMLLQRSVRRSIPSPSSSLFLRTVSSKGTHDLGSGTGSDEGGRFNFDRNVLLPASRGELGSSGADGIPKLAARRNKANLFTGGNRGGAAASSLSYEEEEDDEDRDVDPNNPFLEPHAETMTMITSSYNQSNSYLGVDDGTEDTDQSYVLLNTDVISPSISDEVSNSAEQDLEYLTHLMIDTVRDAAELAIMDASEQRQLVKDPKMIADNEKRREAIMQKLQLTEHRLLNENGLATGSSRRKKYTTNGILNSSLQYLDTNLTHGLKYDGTPSMIYDKRECHPNPYLPHNKYFIGSQTKNAKSSSNNTMMLEAGFQEDTALDEIDLERDDALIDPNSAEAQMLQQEAIIAYAKSLELDIDFGYWCEMDYDHLLGEDSNKNKSELEELSQHAKEDLAKKDALVQLLSEADAETTDVADNDEEELSTLVDGKDGSAVNVNSNSGKGKVAPEPVLSAQDKEAYDFVKWFSKKNSVLEYEHDPSLMTPTELQNLNPIIRKQLTDMGINMNETIDPNDIGDNRDELYDGHPNMIELCSGSDEVVLVEAPHSHQLRRPKPTFRTNVAQPDELFLNQYRRFAYVNKLPPMYLEGNDSKLHPPKLIDINNPVDRTFFQRNVANMFNIADIDQIFPASATSAYIGYKDAIGLATTLMNGPNYEFVHEIEEKIPPPYFEVLPSSSITHKFVTEANETKPESDKCMLQLSNLDTSAGTRYTSASLVKALFSEASSPSILTSNGTGNTNESSNNVPDGAYGNVTADDIHFVNASTAIIRFSSVEQASSVLDSDVLRTRLRGLNSRVPSYMNKQNAAYRSTSMNQRIEVLRARRELIHRGWDTTRGQYRGDVEVLQFGKRLIVDGDLPTKDFYISHAAVVMLTGVDPTIISKLEISNLAQPHCSLQRDVDGSIQWAKCIYSEQPTDRVYIGFDLVGEADAFVKAVGTTTNALYKGKDKRGRRINVKLLRDRHPPNYAPPPLQRRPDRTIEELLQDLNNWEQYVDVADIEYLEKHGISKHVLDEALRAIRYNNDCFGAFDAAVRNETLDPSTHTSPGQRYRELVQLYVETLKECIATPENPGESFMMQQYPNQEPDLGYFEYETKRLERIKNERGIKSS